MREPDDGAVGFSAVGGQRRDRALGSIERALRVAAV